MKLTYFDVQGIDGHFATQDLAIAALRKDKPYLNVRAIADSNFPTYTDEIRAIIPYFSGDTYRAAYPKTYGFGTTYGWHFYYKEAEIVERVAEHKEYVEYTAPLYARFLLDYRVTTQKEQKEAGKPYLPEIVEMKRVEFEEFPVFETKGWDGTSEFGVNENFSQYYRTHRSMANVTVYVEEKTIEIIQEPIASMPFLGGDTPKAL